MKNQSSTSGTSFPIRLYRPARQAVMHAVGIGFMAVFLLLPLSAQAGTLDSPAATTAAGSAMFTITDIYNRLNTGATVTKRVGGFTEPGAAPTAGTGHTLNEVMTLVNSRAHAVCVGTLHGTRWCDNGNGTVTDLTTGLHWLKNGNCFSFKTWDVANISAGTLLSGSCGLSDGSVEGDWRLPTLKELKHLTASGTEDVTGNPTVNNRGAFTGTLNHAYWSSNTVSATPANAHNVHVWDGFVTQSPKTPNSQYVWPVRGQ